MRTTRLGSRSSAAVLSCTALLTVSLGSAATPASEPQDNTSEAGTTTPGGLEEVVVVAQRRAENQQTIPVTVSALTADQLESANVTSALDVGKLVPSLSVTSNSASVLLFMRGVGSNVSAIGSEASVAAYVDNVYYSRLVPSFLRFNSIDHIEVLQGPQGTLFGRNASGGLINVITRDPHVGDPLSVNMKVGYGNYSTTDASMYAASGIGSRMALDLAVNYHDQGEGFGQNIPTGEQRPVDRSTSVRAKLVAELTDTTTVKVTGDYMDAHENIAKQTNWQGLPQGYLDGSGPLPAVSFFDSNTEYSDVDKTEQYGASIRLEQALGFATLVDTLAYHHITTLNPFDVDVSPRNLETSALDSTSEEVLNELQLLSKRGSAVDWVVGLFYMDQDQKYDPAAFGGSLIEGLLGQAFGGPVPSGTKLVFVSDSKVKSIAPYAQARFEIAPKLKATLGARYTRDKLSGSGFQGAILGGTSNIIAFPPTVAESENTFKKVTYKAGLDYEFTDTIFAYASASRGYKGATLNLLPFDPTPTKPEVLDAYELGIKSEWYDHRLRVNADVWYYDIKDPQVIVIEKAVAPTVRNAGAAESKGVEVQFEAAPINDLSLRLSATYLDAKYTDYLHAAFYFPVQPYGNTAALDLSAQGGANGNYLPHAPKVTFNVGGTYRWVLPNQAELTFGANYAYSSKQYFQPDNVIPQPAYGLLDAQLAYKLSNVPLTLTLWGSNLTDEHYYNGQVEFAGPPGTIGFVGAPRTYGASLEYNFKAR
jgi:iron complex outermembrane receptor protein